MPGATLKPIDNPAADAGPTPEDHRLAAELARSTGELLLNLRDEMAQAGISSWELEDEGDRQAHEYLAKRLAEARPRDAFLSEEGRDDKSRLSERRVWIVDPVDGTSEYGQPPRVDWAVHVALAIDGQPVCGAVSLPSSDVVLSTASPPQLGERKPGPYRTAISRWRPCAAAQAVTNGLDGEMVPMGSAGVKAMSVVLGQTDIYAHSGGQYEWDSCAPVAVAKAAGLHASRIDGEELIYNNSNVYLPDYVICRPELADDCLALLADAVKRSRYA